jgi:hypothetical protein
LDRRIVEDDEERIGHLSRCSSMRASRSTGGLASLELVDPLAGDTGDRPLSRRPSTIGLMKAQPRGVVIDASLRFARSNPDLTRHARENAGALDVSVDDLLLDAIARVVASRRADVRHTTPTMMGACGVHVLAAGGAPR